VEVAPASNLPHSLRVELCSAAVQLAKKAGYRNAGTVEFLFDVDTHKWYFIEVNPRIQVEHTVTEMVTGIDLVRAQIRVAQGHSLHDEPLSLPKQDAVPLNGFAIQCRVTTEDPENHFAPDYGKITTYRSPAGFGIRLDGGTAYAGAVLAPYYDSLLVKVTAWDGTLDGASHRMDRALREFRIRGVKTNIPFLENVVNHQRFRSGQVTTSFLDDSPELFLLPRRGDRATKVLHYLGDIILNGDRFVLNGGTIEFVNPSETQPVVNLALNTTIQQYNIFMRFNGPVDQLRTNYSSDPSLPAADIINLLAFGTTTEASANSPSTPANQAAESLVASQVSSQVSSRVSKVAGISQLSINPVLAGGTSQGPPGANITIQQRVTGNLFVTFSSNVASTQNQTIQGQYQISPRVAVSATRDQSGGFGFDTLIKKTW